MRHRLDNPLLPAAVTCLAAAGVLLAALPPAPARATKEYARKEGKDCSHCHVNPKGSGPRNATGKEYEANGHRFGVKSWSSEENRRKYLRARSALMSTWYGETDRLLRELEESETLPGGRALIDGTRAKYRMFPRTWLRAARKLLEKGSRGVPNALAFLAKLESQFPDTDEGGQAVALLDEMAEKDDTRDAVDAARRGEAARLAFLRARTAYELGELDDARRRLDALLADPDAADWHADVRELLAKMQEGAEGS